MRENNGSASNMIYLCGECRSLVKHVPSTWKCKRRSQNYYSQSQNSDLPCWKQRPTQTIFLRSLSPTYTCCVPCCEVDQDLKRLLWTRLWKRNETSKGRLFDLGQYLATLYLCPNYKSTQAVSSVSSFSHFYKFEAVKDTSVAEALGQRVARWLDAASFGRAGPPVTPPPYLPLPT